MQNNKVSGSTASGLLKKINHYELLGTQYLFKGILLGLTGFRKTFQRENSNFLIISLVIDRCKSKILEVAKDYKVIQ